MRTRLMTVLAISGFLLMAIPAFCGGRPSPVPGETAWVLPLKEGVRITGESDKYFFKRPRRIRIAEDDHIFVSDEDQLLEFDADGRFVRNFFRKGEGPGELQNLHDFGFRGDHIIIHQTYPNKIVTLDRSGDLVADYRPAEQTSNLLAIRADYLLMAHSAFREDKQKSEGVVDMDWKIMKVFPDGRCDDLGLRFDTQMYGKKIGRAYIANNITDLIGVPLPPPLLVLTHTSDYLIKLVDTEERRVINSFARAYKRVKSGSKGGMVQEKSGTTLSVPRKFHNDVLRLFTHCGKIWALTSTHHEERGWLVDVFDENGDVLDHFHLPLHKQKTRDEIARLALTVTDKAIFTVETGPDDLPYVISYIILG